MNDALAGLGQRYGRRSWACGRLWASIFLGVVILMRASFLVGTCGQFCAVWARGHLPALVGGVAGVFRVRHCGRSSLRLWAGLGTFFGACGHVSAGLWLGLWAALWVLVGGLGVEKVRLLCAGHPISLRALNKTSHPCVRIG